MTTEQQPEALRARLLDHAACHEREDALMSDPEQRQWAADLREAEALIDRQYAELEALRSVSRNALVALESATSTNLPPKKHRAAIVAMRAAIAAQQPKEQSHE